MRKSEYTLDATHIPNNLELCIAALRCGRHKLDEVADHTGLDRSQAEWALGQLSSVGHAEYRRGPAGGWYATDDGPLQTVLVESDGATVWGAFGYPTGVIAPLVGRVHRMAG